jgi:hypothetical protein
MHCLQMPWPKQRNKLSSKKSSQEIKFEASSTLKVWRFSYKLISALFFSHKNLKFKAVFWTIKNLKQWSFSIWLNTLFIRTLIRAFRSTRSILVCRVEKSKDCNRSAEALSISYLKRFKFIYYLHHSCSVIENPTTITRNICLFEFRHPKVIDHRKHSFEESGSQ